MEKIKALRLKAGAAEDEVVSVDLDTGKGDPALGTVAILADQQGKRLKPGDLIWAHPPATRYLITEHTGRFLSKLLSFISDTLDKRKSRGHRELNG